MNKSREKLIEMLSEKINVGLATNILGRLVELSSKEDGVHFINDVLRRGDEELGRLSSKPFVEDYVMLNKLASCGLVFEAGTGYHYRITDAGKQLYKDIQSER